MTSNQDNSSRETCSVIASYCPCNSFQELSLPHTSVGSQNTELHNEPNSSSVRAYRAFTVDYMRNKPESKVWVDSF